MSHNSLPSSGRLATGPAGCSSIPGTVSRDARRGPGLVQTHECVLISGAGATRRTRLMDQIGGEVHVSQTLRYSHFRRGVLLL